MDNQKILEHLDDIWTFGHEPTDEEREAARDAIDAVQKQIPNKPNKREIGNSLIRKVYHCPNCNKRLYDCAFKNGELDHVSPGSRKRKFCEDCGQAIDWSE